MRDDSIDMGDDSIDVGYLVTLLARRPWSPASKPLANWTKKYALSHPATRARCIVAARKADKLSQTVMAPSVAVGPARRCSRCPSSFTNPRF